MQENEKLNWNYFFLGSFAYFPTNTSEDHFTIPEAHSGPLSDSAVDGISSTRKQFQILRGKYLQFIFCSNLITYQ